MYRLGWILVWLNAISVALNAASIAGCVYYDVSPSHWIINAAMIPVSAFWFAIMLQDVRAEQRLRRRKA